jgi:hypothetical protein
MSRSGDADIFMFLVLQNTVVGVAVLREDMAEMSWGQ